MKFNLPDNNGPFIFTWKTEWYEDSTEELQSILKNKDFDRYIEAVNKLYEDDPAMPIKLTKVYCMDVNSPICQMQTTKPMTVKELEDWFSINTGETPNNLDIEVDVI